MRMNLAGLWFTDESGIPAAYDGTLVASSFVIAALGSYATLEMIGRMRAASGARSRAWQAGSAVALGGGIWAMHFMAMLAMSFPFAVSYDIGRTLLSLLVAIAVTGLGLEIAGTNSLNRVRVGAAGTMIGSGVAAMHYLGMAGIVFSGTIAYTPGLWGLSVVLAIIASTAAVWLSLTMDNALERGAAAVIMAVAFCGFHFTGMSAAIFQISSMPQLTDGVATVVVAIALGVITFLLFVMAMALVLAERKISTDKAEEANFRTKSRAALVAIEQKIFSLNEDLENQKIAESLLSHVFRLVDAPMAVIAENGEFLMTNPALNSLFGSEAGVLEGKPSISYATPVCRERLSKLRNQQLIDRKTYSTDAQFIHADGSAFCMNMTSAIAEEEALRRFQIVTLSRPLFAPPLVDVPRSVVGGKIKFIGLEEMEAVLGADWPAISDRIMNTAEQIIRATLIEGEACSRSGGCSFLLVFETESEDVASERAKAIEQALHEALADRGEDPAGLEIAVATTSVVVPNDSISGSQLASDLVDSALDVSIQEATQTNGRVMHAPFHLAGCLFEPVLTCQRAEFIGHYIGMPPSHPAAAGRTPGLQSVEIQSVIMLASDQYSRDMPDASLNLMFVELNVEALLKRTSLERHLALYKDASLAVRSRLVLLLYGWPAGIPASRVKDLTVALKPFCRTLGLRLSDLTMPQIDLGLFGNPYVAIDANQVGVDCSKNGKLERFVLQIHAKRGRVLIKDVPSMAAVRQLQSLGMDLVSIEANASARPT